MQFEKFGEKLGDVRPANVLIGPSGEVRVFCRLSLPNEPCNYAKTLEYSELTYLGTYSFDAAP